MAQITLYIDGELGELDGVELRTHMKGCPPCELEHQLDVLLKSRISQCCGGEQASEELKTALLAKLRAFSPTSNS